MQNSVISSQRGEIKLSLRRVLDSRITKAVLSLLFGFISALPINPLKVSPLAVASVAVLPQSLVVFGYLGAFTSYIANSFYESAAAVSALTAVMLFRLLFKREGRISSDIYIAPLSVLISLTVTGILCGDISSSSIPDTTLFIAIALLSAGAAIPFKAIVSNYGKNLFRATPATIYTSAVGIFLLLLPLGGVTVSDMNVLSLLTNTLAVYFGARLNNKEALGTALYLGLLLSLGTLSPLSILILTACIMISRIALPLGRLPYIACFISLKFATNLIFSPIIDLIPQMLETLLGCAFIILLPSKLFSRTELIAREKKKSSNAFAAEKVKETAEIFRFLSKSISEVSEAISKELTVTPEGCVEHIKNTLCNRCELSRFCSSVKNEEICTSIRSAASDLINGNRITHPLPRCAHHLKMKDEISKYINQSQASPTQDASDIRGLSTQAYEIVSDALSEISTELTEETAEDIGESDATAKVDYSYLQLKNENELYSGDCHDCFTKGKYLYLILSDGMGSGKLASIDSKMTCGLLKRFLMSGFSFRTCVKLVNTALKLKSSEESFATADICRINTEDGSVSLGKAGAAATYVVSQNRIRKLDALTFPVGILNEVRFEELSYRLRKNECLIMLSDGALNNGEEWLEEQIFFDMEPKKICEKIAGIAKESYGSFPSDDITVIAVKLK